MYQTIKTNHFRIPSPSLSSSSSLFSNCYKTIQIRNPRKRFFLRISLPHSLNLTESTSIAQIIRNLIFIECCNWNLIFLFYLFSLSSICLFSELFWEMTEKEKKNRLNTNSMWTFCFNYWMFVSRDSFETFEINFHLNRCLDH